MIVFDIDQRTLELEAGDDLIQQRLASWKPPAARYKSGVFAKYVALVSSAARGAVTHPEG
jgi:dihydroxy-acid dehydratase